MPRIVARQGDITDTNADVVVNAGNTSLWLGTGVAGAIKKAGGPSIQAELDRIVAVRVLGKNLKTTAHGYTQDGKRWVPSELGEVVVTHAGNMKARYIFHGAVMDSNGAFKGQTNLNIVSEVTRNAILKARELSVYGISFPIFGTGVGGLDLASSTVTIIRTLRRYAPTDTLIRLYAYTEDDYATVDRLVRHV